ncbi:MAG: hypothetical protein WD229_08860, partial [Pirellulales bacterium]
MTVQRITTWEELSTLEAEWNALTGDMPFLSWDWLATWWKHYGGVSHQGADQNGKQATNRQLYVLAVFDDAHCKGMGHKRPLVGVAPWFLDRTIIEGHVIRWLGSGEVCTDHLSLVCRPERCGEVAAAIADALSASCDDWDRLELEAVDANDA